MSFQLEEQVCKVDYKEDDGGGTGNFESVYLLDILAGKGSVEGGGNKKGRDGDSHHGSGCLRDERIIQTFFSFETAKKKAHSEDLN